MSSKERTQVFEVTGMTCGHCLAAVQSAVKATAGVQAAHVDLDSGKVQVDGDFSDQAVIAAVEAAGYEATVAGA